MIDLDKLEAISKAAPQGQWEVWTSDSWRRVMARDRGNTMRVIEPTNHPMDKWPDLIFGDGVQAYLEAIQPSAILELIAEVRTARTLALEEAAKVCTEMADNWNLQAQGARDGRYDFMAEAGDRCADEIRSLVPDQPQPRPAAQDGAQ